MKFLFAFVAAIYFTFASAESNVYSSSPWVQNQIREISEENSGKQPLAWGVGYYRASARFDETLQKEFEWFAYEDKRGYLQIRMSTRLSGMDLYRVREYGKLFHHEFAVETTGKYTGKHAATWIGTKNEWADQVCVNWSTLGVQFGSYRDCKLEEAVRYYLANLNILLSRRVFENKFALLYRKE